MASQEVPTLIAYFAAQVKMTPIAWHIEPAYVVIVFEQGPKMRFERQPVRGGVVVVPLATNHDPPVRHEASKKEPPVMSPVMHPVLPVAEEVKKLPALYKKRK